MKKKCVTLFFSLNFENFFDFFADETWANIFLLMINIFKY